MLVFLVTRVRICFFFFVNGFGKFQKYFEFNHNYLIFGQLGRVEIVSCIFFFFFLVINPKVYPFIENVVFRHIEKML